MKIVAQISFLFFLSLPYYALAGAWNKEKGHGYAQVSYTFLKYGQLLNGDANKIDLKRTISDFTYQFYGEYGISKKLNIVLNLPYKAVSSNGSINEVNNDPYLNDTLESGTLNGLSTIGLTLKLNLIDRNYQLTFLLGFENNMHQYQPNSGLRIGYDAYIISPALLYGKGWTDLYLQAGIGLMLNSSTYSQNTIGNIEVGRRLWNGKSHLALRIDYKLPITVGTFNEGNTVQSGLFRDNSSYISPGIKWMQKIWESWYFNTAIYGAVYSKNEGAQATFNFALAHEW